MRVQSCLVSPYFLSIFECPGKIVKRLERLIRDFFWKGASNENGSILVNWKTTSLPISKGGLGLGNLKCKNISLLAKWGCRFVTEEQCLWKQVVTSKYLCKKGVWIPNPYSLSKGPWKSIFKACCTADKWYKIVVGKGDKIRF